jgi:hypothetical protein
MSRGHRAIKDSVGNKGFLVRPNEVKINLAAKEDYNGDRVGGQHQARYVLTLRRANKLIAALRSGDDRQRWIMELLRCLAQRDKDWRSNLARIARTEKDLPLRRVLSALVPSRTNVSVRQIIARALKDVKLLAPVEREFCHLTYQFNIEVNEGQVLAALQRDPRNVLRLLGDMFFKPSHARYPIEIRRIQVWIDVLYKEFSPGEWIDEHSLLLVCRYLAKATQREAHTKILLWANQPKNPARDFVLGLIVPHISGVTTDDLTPAAAQRLLELYIKEQIEQFPSPGTVATERFVTETVLPYAQSMSDDGWERDPCNVDPTIAILPSCNLSLNISRKPPQVRPGQAGSGDNAVLLGHRRYL